MVLVTSAFARFRHLTMLLVLVLAVTSGCATIPKPTEQSGSAVAITVVADVRSTLFHFDRLNPQTVFFVRLDDSEDIRKGAVLSSNYKDEKWWSSLKDGGYDSFALNVPPGLYAAVAVSGTSGGSGVVLLFPEDVVKASRVMVKPGEVAYMGRYDFESLSFLKGMNGADRCQIYYYDALRGGFPIFARPYAGKIAKISNSRDDEKAFLEGLLGTFEGTDWEEAIKTKLEEIEQGVPKEANLPLH